MAAAGEAVSNEAKVMRQRKGVMMIRNLVATACGLGILSCAEPPPTAPPVEAARLPAGTVPQTTIQSTAQLGDLIIKESITDLGALTGDQNEALWVNDVAQIAGWGQDAELNLHVLFWSSGATTPTDLGTFGGLIQQVPGLNNPGQVLVNSLQPPLLGSPAQDRNRAYVWRKGRATDLGVGSRGAGLNNLGQITGTRKFSFLGFDIYSGFLYSGGVFTLLSGLSGPGSFVPFAINDKAQIAGVAYTGIETHAALWEDGVSTDLGTLGGPSSRAWRINQKRQVIGQSCRAGELDPCESHAFFWADGVMTDLGSLGGSATEAIALNNSGQVVGVSETAAGEQHAFLWKAGVMTDLGTLGGSFSKATGVNDGGEVVGTSFLASGESRAFVWNAGVMVRLLALGGSSGGASTINNRGDIAGSSGGWPGDPPNKTHATLWHVDFVRLVGCVGCFPP